MIITDLLSVHFSFYCEPDVYWNRPLTCFSPSDLPFLSFTFWITAAVYHSTFGEDAIAVTPAFLHLLHQNKIMADSSGSQSLLPLITLVSIPSSTLIFTIIVVNIDTVHTWDYWKKENEILIKHSTVSGTKLCYLIYLYYWDCH